MQFLQWALCGLCVGSVWALCGLCVGSVLPRPLCTMSPTMVAEDVVHPLLAHHSASPVVNASDKASGDHISAHRLLATLCHGLRAARQRPHLRSGEDSAGAILLTAHFPREPFRVRIRLGVELAHHNRRRRLTGAAFLRRGCSEWQQAAFALLFGTPHLVERPKLRFALSASSLSCPPSKLASRPPAVPPTSPETV